MTKGKIFVCTILILIFGALLTCLGISWQKEVQELMLSNAQLQKQYEDLSIKYQESEENIMILSFWVEQDEYDSIEKWWIDLQNYRTGYLHCDEKVLNGESAKYITEEQKNELKRIAEAIEKSRSLKETKDLVKQFNKIVEDIDKQKNKAIQKDSVKEEIDSSKSSNIENTPEEYSVATTEAYSWQVETEPSYESPSSGLTQESGVNYHNDRTETYYSSNVLYHHQTSEWTVDDEGFYRTDDGYYVVAASDMEQGTVFEGSKGTCVVLDSGCDAGVTDYYVAW